MRKRKNCPSGKVRFSDKRQAIHALHRIQLTSNRQVKPCRVYPCGWCNGFHLSSHLDDSDYDNYIPVAGVRQFRRREKIRAHNLARDETSGS